MSQQIPEVVNGVRLQVVADLAAFHCDKNKPVNDLSTDEIRIANIARNCLHKLRGKGYAKQQCRLGFWNKIVSEAMKVKVA